MLPTETKCYSFSLLLLCTLGLRKAMSITLTLWLTFWKAHVRLWILMLMHKWIASTLRYATVQALVLQILYNKCTYTLICIWTLTGGLVCWILKHYLLIPGDDISSDLDLSGCNINTDNEEEDESYTKLIEIMDPHADAQMDCIYFEVCNCMGSSVADIV